MNRRLSPTEAAEARDRRWQEAAEVEARAGRFGRRRARRTAQHIRTGEQR